MKQKLIIMLFLLSGVLPIAAQNQWGIIGGINFSSTNNKDFTWKPGGYLGILYDMPLDRSWSFQPRLYVSYEHFQNRDKELPAWGVMQPSYNQWNITLPLLASFKLNPGDQTVLSLHAGPYLQYSMFGRIEASYLESENNHVSYSKSWSQDFGRHFSYGIYTGLSMERERWITSFDFKYNLRSSTLSSLAKHEMSLSVGVGYKF